MASSVIGVLALTGCSSGGSETKAGADCAETTQAHLLLQTGDLDVSYIPYGILADELGYMAEECIDLSVDVTLDSAIQSLMSGKTDFVMAGPEQLLSVNNGDPFGGKMIYNLIPDLNIYLAVLDESPIRSTADLAGKTIGLESSSSMYDAFLAKSLEPHGLELDDLDFVVTGYGSTPPEALKSGEVDAVLYWPGMFTSWEAAGYDIRILEGTEWSADFDGIGIAARDDYIAENPEVVEGFSRALAKSAVYLQQYPESAIRLFWDAYPERAPLPGADEAAALERDKAVLESTVGSMRIDTYPADYVWGTQTPERWAAHIAYLQGAGLVDPVKTVDPADFIVIDHLEAANDFSAETITEQ